MGSNPGYQRKKYAHAAMTRYDSIPWPPARMPMHMMRILFGCGVAFELSDSFMYLFALSLPEEKWEVGRGAN